MNGLRHSERADTKLTLHLVSQMMGKIKLALAPQEPQWAHVTLPLTVNGFSTGPLWSGETLFEIDVDVAVSAISVQVETNKTVIPLEAGKSIQFYYELMFGALRTHGVTVAIHPKSQEMRDVWWLDKDESPLAYDAKAAQKGVRLFQFAAREQAAFLAPLRCRKVKPALFWGTFDVSSMIVYGKSEPFPEDKLIEKAAFDEHMIEFGFWLGDESVDVLSEQLGWEGCDHYFLPLDMPTQQELTDDGL